MNQLQLKAKRFAEESETRRKKREAYQKKEWYTCRSILGNQWAFFYILLGARERGKSYSVMKHCLVRWKKHGEKFFWIRLSEASTKKMLTNNAAQFVDADLYRSFDLDLTVKGNVVYDHGEPMAYVLALSTAHNDKGVALFDNAYNGNFNIVLDEFQLERSQRRTFDVSYNLVVELENLVRSRKEKIHIFMIGNSTEEVSDILAMFEFIPQDFGIYKLKKKKCVIDYMPNSEAYVNRRKGTVGDILAGDTSNFTNSIETDVSRINKKRRLHSPQYIIKFSKEKRDWFTVWDGNVVAKYNGEKKKNAVAMRRYIDEQFDPIRRDMVYSMQDSRAFLFRNLITQKTFIYQLSLIKKA